MCSQSSSKREGLHQGGRPQDPPSQIDVLGLPREAPEGGDDDSARDFPNGSHPHPSMMELEETTRRGAGAVIAVLSVSTSPGPSSPTQEHPVNKRSCLRGDCPELPRWLGWARGGPCRGSCRSRYRRRCRRRGREPREGAEHVAVTVEEADDRVATPHPSPDPNSFRASIGHALLTAYCFSLIHPEAGQKCCRWTICNVLRMLYAGLVVAGLGAQALLSIYREMTSESLWDSSVDMMFFGSATAAAVLFLEMGRKWWTLMAAFESVETQMTDFGYPPKLRKHMKELTAAVMIAAVVEHLLSVWSAVVYVWPCYDEAGMPGLLRGYAFLKFPMTFEVVAYEHWRAVLVLVLNFVGTFYWNFTHLFIMLISIPLSNRFRQLNERLEDTTGKVMTDAFWRQARETYNELSVLARKVDMAVGKLVLLSFATNMYFICRQLLHSFRTLNTGFWYNVYFSYSFGYMLARTVLVSLIAAAVNDQSKKPLLVLFSVPSQGYTPEVERFMSQVTRDSVALTGCRFFSVTRGLILTVAGTIISYEIVLMQLHQNATGSIQKIEKLDHCF